EGDIREYRLQFSNDGNDWSEAAHGELLSTFHPQRILFTKPVVARYLKLTAISGFGPDRTVSLAEIAVIVPGSETAAAETIRYQRSKRGTTEIDEGPDDHRPTRKSTAGRKN